MSPHLGSFCSPFCASSCVKEPVTQTRYKETKGFLQLYFQILSADFGGGTPTPYVHPISPKVTQSRGPRHARFSRDGVEDTQESAEGRSSQPSDHARSSCRGTRPFSSFVANKSTSPIRRLRDPLGDAWVAQGPPKRHASPNPNPSRQRVATSKCPRQRCPFHLWHRHSCLCAFSDNLYGTYRRQLCVLIKSVVERSRPRLRTWT